MIALLRAAWAARKPYVDDDGDVYSRRDVWALSKPAWTHTIATTQAPCGCRRRFGLWHTIYCADHVFGPRMGGAS